MPVTRRRAALSGANLMIFSGRVAREDLLLQFGMIDETQPDTWSNWLIVDLGRADISELNFDVLEELKALLRPKMQVMKARRSFDVVIVCERRFNEPIYKAWKLFVSGDADYPSSPLVFASLQSACSHLGYQGPEYRELFELCTGAP